MTEQPTKSPGGAFFNEDGNKEKDVEHVGARAPDSDPAEEPEEP